MPASSGSVVVIWYLSSRVSGPSRPCAANGLGVLGAIWRGGIGFRRERIRVARSLMRLAAALHGGAAHEADPAAALEAFAIIVAHRLPFVAGDAHVEPVALEIL